MNIIVNGGTKGIGREVVLYFVQNKTNRILVTGRNNDELKKLSSEYNNILTLNIDISESDRFVKVYESMVSDHLQTVDIVINMAGYLVVNNFVDFTNDEARKMMETNFFGPASLIRAIVPYMKRGSHIINISSMGGFQGSSKYKGLSYYSASKAALSCLTECLANEFSELDISVNCLALGAVQTEMFEKAFPGATAGIDARKMAEFISDFALKGNQFINGKIIPVAISNP
jgi:short-subunit dehydrogenase